MSLVCLLNCTIVILCPFYHANIVFLCHSVPTVHKWQGSLTSRALTTNRNSTNNCRCSVRFCAVFANCDTRRGIPGTIVWGVFYFFSLCLRTNSVARNGGCMSNEFAILKDFWHLSHENGFWPVWIFIWFLRVSVEHITLPQILHMLHACLLSWV